MNTSATAAEDTASCRTAASSPFAPSAQKALPPCCEASPLGVNYRSLAALLASGQEEQACEELRQVTPFAGLLAALGDTAAASCCPVLKKNARLPLGETLPYLTRKHPEIFYRPLPANIPASGKKAAVIGSGPAGLQGAWSLRQKGHDVTIFEAAPTPGVTLLHAPVQESASGEAATVNALPQDIVERTIAMLQRSGIRFVTSAPKGQTELHTMLEEYDLVFCACGKGAVLPADAHGQVTERLFAAGTCVKNQKHLNALQAMAFAKKSACAACRLLEEGCPEMSETQSVPASESLPCKAQKEKAAAASPAELTNMQEEAARCLACPCQGTC